MEFIRLSFRMAECYKNHLRVGVFLTFPQNASILFSLCALLFVFGWVNKIAGKHIRTIFGVLFTSFLFNFLTRWVKSSLSDGVFFDIFRDHRLAVGERLKKTPMEYFAEQSFSRIMPALTNVMKSPGNYSSMSIDFTVSGISVSFFLLISTSDTSLKIGILAPVCLTLTWFCAIFTVNQAKKETVRECAVVTEVGGALVDSINGIPAPRSPPLTDAGVVEEVHSKLKNSSEEFGLSQVHFEMASIVYVRIFPTAISLSSLPVTLFSCYFYTKDEILLP